MRTDKQFSDLSEPLLFFRHLIYPCSLSARIPIAQSASIVGKPCSPNRPIEYTAALIDGSAEKSGVSLPSHQMRGWSLIEAFLNRIEFD